MEFSRCILKPVVSLGLHLIKDITRPVGSLILRPVIETMVMSVFQAAITVLVATGFTASTRGLN